ncbi:MAG: hypothetical protein WCF12_09220 [Propionicimonas sp.]
MNTNSPTSVNSKAVIAVMAVFLFFAVLFGSPAGSATAEPNPVVVAGFSR